MPQSTTDWGRGGHAGFLRDPNNEQVAPLAASAAYTGQWTRVDKTKSFALLYGTHVPFTMQIQWSKDGVSQDLDPFATITPQVRNRLGLYSVISFQSTFFRPFYRMRIVNGPSAQLFVISDALLMDSVFDGYLIDVDGPIPALGLAMLSHGLAWGRSPTGWSPQQLTAGLNQKVALVENLLSELPVRVLNPTANPETGLATQVTLAQISAKLDALTAAVEALEQVQVTLDAASLAGLESISVQNNVTTDVLDRAARLLGAVSVSNLPAVQPVSGTVGLDASSLAALAAAQAVAAGTPTHLSLVGTTLIKTGAGVLERVIVNKISAAASVTLTLHNAVTADPAKILAVITLGATAPGSSGVAAPASLDYFAAFTAGLTAVVSAVGADVTLVWR